MKLFFFFISFYLFQSEVINLKDNSKVSHWIESGNIQLYTNKWITITTTKVFNSPVIFLRYILLLLLLLLLIIIITFMTSFFKSH